MIEQKQKPNTAKEIRKILNPLVKQWFFSQFNEFSLPQLYGVMEIHSRNNILISAPTGATKTLTGFLSILNELVDSSQKGILEDRIYCVYISPLKALNYDIEVNLLKPLKGMEELANKKLGIRVAVRTGDTTQAERSKMLKNPPHILITTPESLGILLSTSKFREHLKQVEWCILDEVHALAENKRGVHLSISMERLERLSNHMTRVGLSATVAPLEEMARFLVGPRRDCKIVDVEFLKKLDLKVLCPVPDLINTTYEELSDETYSLIDKLIQEHTTTLIFTNTRAGTERVVHHLKEKFTKHYIGIDEDTEGEFSLIGAHHGSLSKRHRFKIEDELRKGKLKAVVCSTSLELGIDIGYIDLVILLGSPKSVARALQRVGRAGHRLHDTTKGRIVVMDRDDLVECSVLLKNAVERKIDRIHIPTNSLDVLAQQIFGMAIAEKWNVKELFQTIKKSYCFKDLKWEDFEQILDYLSGEFSSLEDRNIYAKIWYDRETEMIGKRGKMARVIYMTNIGTIPEQRGVIVKAGEHAIGKIDEAFLEKLRKGDIFVLGGNCYRFNFARGMVAQVTSAEGKRPTVPSWYSEMLPLSFDLATEIQKFRRMMETKLKRKIPKENIIEFINNYLYVDKNAAEAIYRYFKEQYDYSEIPNSGKLLIEHYSEGDKKYHIFHSLYGRRVNEVLSRAIAYVVAKVYKTDVEIGLNDNGFYLGTKKKMSVLRAFKKMKSEELRKLMEVAIDNTEVLKRRFRHCAARALMILRQYKGHRKRVGRQQVSSMILMRAVKRISNDFAILKEARREVLEDLMDIENAEKVLEGIEEGKINLKEIRTEIPTPFAFNLVLQGYSDILKMDDKLEFLKRMHNMVLAKIDLKTRRDKKFL